MHTTPLIQAVTYILVCWLAHLAQDKTTTLTAELSTNNNNTCDNGKL